LATSPTSPSRDSIRVSDHALERARERHADLRLLAEREVLRMITREVGTALREQRIAKTAPRELLRPPVYNIRSKADRGCRFAWNAALSRAYVVKRTAGVWLVITVLDTVHSQA
jgi:hypothetical protein